MKISNNANKSLFVQKSENINNFFSPKKQQQKTVLLVLPFEEIILQPEISSPPPFGTQGGVPLALRTDGQTEILVSNIGLLV